MKISMVRNNGQGWITKNGISAKGHFITQNGSYFEGKEMVKFLDNNIENEKDLLKLLHNVNGNFAFVIEHADYIYIVSDQIRSFPIFYSINENEIIISDEIDYIVGEIKDVSINKNNILELLMTGFVTGNETVYENIYQLNAGKYLIYSKSKNKIMFEKLFCINSEDFEISSMDNIEQLISELDKKINEVFLDFIRSINGKTVILPLSGGYDSRIIAYYLKKLNYNKVICYTYGHKNQVDVKLAKELANYLGFEWHFIPYNRKELYRLFQSKEAKLFREYSSNGSVIPHLQDWSAVYYLTSKKLIPNDSVFVPGHTAFLSFQNYTNGPENNKDILLDDILNKHYILWSINRNTKNAVQQYKTNIKNITNEIENEGYFNNFNKMYFWEWQERHAKFICNSVRVYEIFNYEWRLPLWDSRLIRFWFNLDIQFTINKNIFKEYMNNYFNNEIHSPNPERTLKLKITERLFSYHRLGRFNGNKSLLGSIFTTNDAVVKNKELFKIPSLHFIDEKKLILFENYNSVVSLVFMDEFIEKHKESFRE